jgi:Fe-S cluster assembly ATP-binding protein
MTDQLVITDLEVSAGTRKILRGLTLTVAQGEVHALMGPNGSGKTSLAYALLGHPDYKVDAGDITWQGQSLLKQSPDKRARAGMFLAFQYPSAIPGVTVASFLRNIYNAVHHPRQPDADGDGAAVNDGFSGGEKKRLEMLQLAVQSPKMAILDETDSGLDIDALRNVADGINATLSPEMGVLMITHYQRMLNYVKPSQVHVLMDGRIVMSGGEELSHQLEANGYDWVREQVGLPSGAGDEVVAQPAETASH